MPTKDFKASINKKSAVFVQTIVNNETTTPITEEKTQDQRETSPATTEEKKSYRLELSKEKLEDLKIIATGTCTTMKDLLEEAVDNYIEKYRDYLEMTKDLRSRNRK